MENGTIKKNRGPLPVQDEDGSIILSYESFGGADTYRAIAGRAKDRADYYYRYVIEHFDIDNPDLSHDGNLELFVAWAAFSCEVYFKCILFHINAEYYFSERPDGGKRLLEHDLFKLFHTLVESDEKHKSNYSTQISDGMLCFEAQLSNVNKYFEQYRYDFEMDEESLNYLFIFNLMKRMHSITDSIQFVKSMEIYQRKDKSLVLS